MPKSVIFAKNVFAKCTYTLSIISDSIIKSKLEYLTTCKWISDTIKETFRRHYHSKSEDKDQSSRGLRTGSAGFEKQPGGESMGHRVPTTGRPGQTWRNIRTTSRGGNGRRKSTERADTTRRSLLLSSSGAPRSCFPLPSRFCSSGALPHRIPREWITKNLTLIRENAQSPASLRSLQTSPNADAPFALWSSRKRAFFCYFVDRKGESSITDGSLMMNVLWMSGTERSCWHLIVHLHNEIGWDFPNASNVK